MKHRITAFIATALMASLPALAGDLSGPAPQFTLAAKGGNTLSLAQYKGQVVMLNFWASWCGPCRQEMPLLQDIYKKYNKMGFTLIGVNVEPDSKEAEGFLKQLQTPVSFPVEAAARRFSRGGQRRGRRFHAAERLTSSFWPRLSLLAVYRTGHLVRSIR